MNHYTSAAFDTVDYDIFIDHRWKAFGIDGAVPSWIKSFIHERTQLIVVAGHESSQSAINCGVPHGSVLGTILFLLYTVDVTMITHKHGLDAHSYADGTQLHFDYKPNSCSSWLPRLALCNDEIDKWMSANRLKLNAIKTQLIWLGTRQQLAKVNYRSVNLNGVDLQSSADVTCIGVVFYSDMNFVKHIR